ncbi:MAG: cytochrome c biogenesis protein ResB [Elusimicrobia bacterium]|nr:cytochrome c biogenesis protein ResB [Elusimicrobiota bacterium]
MNRHNKEEAASGGWSLANLLGSTRLLYGLLPALIILSVAGTLVDDIYHSVFYTFLPALLAVNLGLCTWRRRPMWGRRPDVLTTHAGVLAILAGGMVTAVTGTRGSLPLNVGELRDHVEAGTGSFHLPFGVRLADFTIERHQDDRHRLVVASLADGWTETVETTAQGTVSLRSGAATLKVLGYYPDFVIDGGKAATRSQSPNNPALRLEVSDAKGKEAQWLFAKFGDFYAAPKSRYKVTYELHPGRIKQFRSDVEVVEGGWVAAKASLSVNSPLRWKGWTLYQSGYDPDNPYYSSLLVSRDPGVPVVYAGFLLLCVGVTWTYLRAGSRRPAVPS